nr:NADH dehydrogenase subunit 3 [Nigrobaetis niger]
MFMILILSAIWLGLSLLLCLLSLGLSWKSYSDREKMSPFECGFDPNGSSRLPFSLRFYLIALIFLIFDVEIVLILPVVPLFMSVSSTLWYGVTSFFVIILLLGLYYEWDQGALSWK